MDDTLKSIRQTKKLISQMIRNYSAINDELVRQNQALHLSNNEMKFKVKIIDRDNTTIEQDNTRLMTIALIKKVEGTV
jgi:hypothetical protein